MDQTRCLETSSSCHHCRSPSDSTCKVNPWQGVQSEAIKRPRAVRPRCLPMPPGGSKWSRQRPRGGKTSLPSDAFSRGVVWTAEVEGVGSGLYAQLSKQEDNHSLVNPAGATGHSFPPDTSTSESNLYRTPGSSRKSSPATGTSTRCNITTEGDTGAPHTLPLTLSPNLSVLSQTSWGEESEAGAGEPATEARQPRAAAVLQQGLMRSLLNDDLL